MTELTRLRRSLLDRAREVPWLSRAPVGPSARQLALPRASQQTPGSGVGAWGTAARQWPTPQRLASGTIVDRGRRACRRAGERQCHPQAQPPHTSLPVRLIGLSTNVSREQRAYPDTYELTRRRNLLRLLCFNRQ
jgi:hypothetical protein